MHSGGHCFDTLLSDTICFLCVGSSLYFVLIFLWVMMNDGDEVYFSLKLDWDRNCDDDVGSTLKYKNHDLTC